MDFKRKEKYNMSDVLNIIELLRSPEGCPWDRVQTHKTVRSNFIEEVYEAVEAIDDNNMESLKEELGDVLFQIVFHCSIEKEKGNFDFDDVADAICKKLVERHPHIFSGAVANNDKHANKIWDEMKYSINIDSTKDSIKIENMRDSVKNVSKFLPALMRTEKIQNRAAKEGYGIFSVEEAIIESFDRIHYLSTVIMKGLQSEYHEAIGDLLFSVTEIARLIDVDAESAMYDSGERFAENFHKKILLEKQNDI